MLSSLPTRDEIPKEFFEHEDPWRNIAADWFFEGGTLNSLGLTIKPGVDKQAAVSTLQTLLESRAFEHNHKMAGVGYLISQWFDRK